MTLLQELPFLSNHITFVFHFQDPQLQIQPLLEFHVRQISPAALVPIQALILLYNKERMKHILLIKYIIHIKIYR